MKRRVIVLPALIVLAGLITFFTIPLKPPIPVMILIADIFGALTIGLVLWRQGQP